MGRMPIPSGTIKPRIDGSLSANEINNIIYKKCDARPIIDSGKGSLVIFLPHAWDNFCASTNYGKWTAENELESQYFLEGYFFVDKRMYSTAVVTNVVTPFSASQNHAAAELYSEGRTNAYEIVEQKEADIKKYASCGKDMESGVALNPFFKDYGPPHRVGFGHTHPNIGVFFSGTDKTSVFAAEGEPWVTMVADPRRCQLLVATGKALSPSRIVVFDTIKSTKLEQRSVSASLNDVKIQDLLEMFAQALGNNIKVDFDISGHFPGKIKFKGNFTYPVNKKRRG